MLTRDKAARIPPVRRKVPRGRSGPLASESRYGYALTLPLLLGFLAFVLGPILAVFWFSLQQRSLIGAEAVFVGLEGYRELVADPLFSRVLTNTLVFSAGLVPLNMVLAFMLALALNRRFRGSAAFEFVMFSPVTVSAVAWALVWTFMLQGNQGFVNQGLSLLGIQGPIWLRESGWAMAAVIVTRALKNVGLNMVLFLAGLHAVPDEIVEAAQLEGARQRQIIRHIILPLMAPTILLVSIVTFIGSFKIFDHIFLMTQGGPENSTMVLVYYVWFQAFQRFDVGYAARLSVVLFLVVLVLTVTQWALRRRFVHAES